MANEAWLDEVTKACEDLSQPIPDETTAPPSEAATTEEQQEQGNNHHYYSSRRRRLTLPEIVFGQARVEIEWPERNLMLSWNATDVLYEWAAAHQHGRGKVSHYRENSRRCHQRHDLRSVPRTWTDSLHQRQRRFQPQNPTPATNPAPTPNRRPFTHPQLLLPFFAPVHVAQLVQVGIDMDGENPGDWSGISLALSSNGAVVAISHDLDGSAAGDEFVAGRWHHSSRRC